MLSYNITLKCLQQLEQKLCQNMCFWRFCDVTVTSPDVKNSKKLYRRNLWAKAFDLMCYSTMFDEIRFFRKFRPWANFSRSRSKATVKVMSDGPWAMLWDKLNLKCLWQLELKLCQYMCFSPFVWPWTWPLTLNSQKLIDCSLEHEQSSHQISWDSVKYFQSYTNNKHTYKQINKRERHWPKGQNLTKFDCVTCRRLAIFFTDEAAERSWGHSISWPSSGGYN